MADVASMSTGVVGGDAAAAAADAVAAAAVPRTELDDWADAHAGELLHMPEPEAKMALIKEYNRYRRKEADWGNKNDDRVFLSFSSRRGAPSLFSLFRSLTSF